MSDRRLILAIPSERLKIPHKFTIQIQKGKDANGTEFSLHAISSSDMQYFKELYFYPQIMIIHAVFYGFTS